MLHGDQAAHEVAEITQGGLTPEQQAAQEALLKEQEEKQARLLMEQYDEKKEMEKECDEEEEIAKGSIDQQIDQQKLKVCVVICACGPKESPYGGCGDKLAPKIRFIFNLSHIQLT